MGWICICSTSWILVWKYLSFLLLLFPYSGWAWPDGCAWTALRRVIAVVLAWPDGLVLHDRMGPMTLMNWRLMYHHRLEKQTTEFMERKQKHTEFFHKCDCKDCSVSKLYHHREFGDCWLCWWFYLGIPVFDIPERIQFFIAGWVPSFYGDPWIEYPPLLSLSSVVEGWPLNWVTLLPLQRVLDWGIRVFELRTLYCMVTLAESIEIPFRLVVDVDLEIEFPLCRLSVSLV